MCERNGCHSDGFFKKHILVEADGRITFGAEYQCTKFQSLFYFILNNKAFVLHSKMISFCLNIKLG